MQMFFKLLCATFLIATNAFLIPNGKGKPLPTITPLFDTTKEAEKTKNSDYQTRIDEINVLLKKAANSRDQDSEVVFEALEDLEKLMRVKCSSEPEFANEILENLNGSWRLIFTTGTKNTQEKIKGRINYFPIKAVQSFSTKTTPFSISNGIYLFNNPALKFSGEFDFDLKFRKLEFDFDEIAIFGFKINLGKGQAAQIGASSGLGSKNNVERARKDKKAFFKWISADGDIATARGGGGGIALWKRIDPEE